MSVLCERIKKMKCVYCTSSINVLFVFTWTANYCLFGSFFRPEGATIVLAAFCSSGLHGELFYVFINLRPACLEATGWLLDLGAPCLLHLTCTQESSITCPAWGPRWMVSYTGALEKIMLYFPAQRGQFIKNHTPLVYNRFELELFALINKSGYFWQWQVKKHFCDHKKQHRRNSVINLQYFYF